MKKEEVMTREGVSYINSLINKIDKTRLNSSASLCFAGLVHKWKTSIRLSRGEVWKLQQFCFVTTKQRPPYPPKLHKMVYYEPSEGHF